MRGEAYLAALQFSKAHLGTAKLGLVQCTPGGTERVLATSVAAYDIDLDGTVIYSNGRGVFVLAVELVERHAQR